MLCSPSLKPQAEALLARIGVDPSAELRLRPAEACAADGLGSAPWARPVRALALVRGALDVASAAPGRYLFEARNALSDRPPACRPSARHDASFKAHCTLCAVWVLLNGGGLPSFPVPQVFAHFASAEHEKERLEYFASSEGRDDLWRYCGAERRTLLEARSREIET